VIDGIRYAEIGATGVDVGTPNTGLGIFDSTLSPGSRGRSSTTPLPRSATSTGLTWSRPPI